jgi:hypothetical protein
MSTDIYSREELCNKHLVKMYFDPPDEELYDVQTYKILYGHTTDDDCMLINNTILGAI